MIVSSWSYHQSLVSYNHDNCYITLLHYIVHNGYIQIVILDKLLMKLYRPYVVVHMSPAHNGVSSSAIFHLHALNYLVRNNVLRQKWEGGYQKYDGFASRDVRKLKCVRNYDTVLQLFLSRYI